LHSVNATVLHTPWQMFAFQIHLTWELVMFAKS
jgi:hypothetical protein